MGKKTKPNTFVAGMVSDFDPRFQKENTYRNASNVKLINSEGGSLSIENINGNTLTLDFSTLTDIDIVDIDDNILYDNNTPFVTNSWDCYIAGYFSFKNELILIVVNNDNKSVFFRILFNPNGTLNKIIDLQVCWADQGNTYPEINMNYDRPLTCRVEGVIENSCITRIYWTDNFNPLRTFNITDKDLKDYDPTELDMTPIVDASQAVLDEIITGDLTVGVYQYTYKYISEGGGESGMSPLSLMYHVSDKNTSSYVKYHGGPPETQSGIGHKVKIYDIDQDMEYIELYALLWEGLDIPPRIFKIGRKQVVSDEVFFSHSINNQEIEDGIAKILVQSNSWDVCKDIAMKDNILFAANLRSKKNFITEKEWNVRVLRYNRGGTAANGYNQVAAGLRSYTAASLTTTDTSIKMYELDSSGNPTEVDTSNFTNTSYTEYTKLNIITPDLTNQNEAHRYLRDGITLGGESYNFNNSSGNGLGGCRVTFTTNERNIDSLDNENESPFVSANSPSEEYAPDGTNSNINTTFKSVFNMGGSKDPQITSLKRGYQRGETYRFGVLVYDKSGNPGNVLWIGDIQMPEMHDNNRMLAITNKGNFNDTYSSVNGSSDGSSSITVPFNARQGNHIICSPTEQIKRNGTTGEFNNGSGGFRIKGHDHIQDYRLDTYRDIPTPQMDSIYNHPDEYTGGGSGTTDVNNDTTLGNIADNGKLKRRGYPNTPILPADGNHYVYDLNVVFEFIIPDDVLSKISGFRIVRAERTENDRTVLQQGLLGQTTKYGNLEKEGLTIASGGTTTTGTSSVINGTTRLNGYHHAGTDRAGDSDDFSTFYDNTESQPPAAAEYDKNLNGYFGLWELGRALRSGATQSGWTGSQNYYYQHEGDHFMDHFQNVEQRTWSSYFGSVENIHGTDNALSALTQLYTFDSPDSAFGTAGRPYIYRAGDTLKINSILKLHDNARSSVSHGSGDNNVTSTTGTGSGSLGFNTNSFGITQQGVFSLDTHQATSYNDNEHNGLNSDAANTAFRFAAKKITDSGKGSGILIGKWFTFDTYFNYDCQYNDGAKYSNDGNQTIWDRNVYGDNENSNASPYNDTTKKWIDGLKYSVGISNAKELSEGEIISTSFITAYDTVGYNGFSNNTLGAGFHTQTIKWKRAAKITNTITSSGDKAHKFDLMSSMQKGLRTILLELEDPLSIMNVGRIIDNAKSTAGDLSATVDGQGGFAGTTNVAGSSSTANDINYSHNFHLIPFKYLASIVRESSHQYGGDDLESIESTRYIPCGNFHSVLTGNNDHLSVAGSGDTFINFYSHQKTACHYHEGNRSFAKWNIFPVESYVNTDMRSGLHLNAGDSEEGFDVDFPPISNDWFYNDVYSQENNIKGFFSIRSSDCEFLDLPYEVAYSRTKLIGEDADAFRIFPIFNFHDVEGMFGDINKIVNFKNEIYVIQENGFAKLLVNPRTFIQDAVSGTSIFTGTGETVENHMYISTEYGTRHTLSVCKSDNNLYFIDSSKEKIIAYDGSKMNVISDSLGQRNFVQKALSFNKLKSYDKISDSNRIYINEIPLNNIGIISGFDYKNREAVFTFLDRSSDFIADGVLSSEKTLNNNTIVFNEALGKFTSKYSINPLMWIQTNHGLYTPGNRLSHVFNTHYLHNSNLSIETSGTYVTNSSSFDELINVNLSATDREVNSLSKNSSQLWQWDSNFDNKCLIFGSTDESFVEIVINEHPSENKKFDNIQIISSPNNVFEDAYFLTDIVNMQLSDFTVSNEDILSKYREGSFRLPLRGNIKTIGNINQRMLGTYLKFKLRAETTNKFNIFAILAKFRKSYN